MSTNATAALESASSGAPNAPAPIPSEMDRRLADWRRDEGHFNPLIHLTELADGMATVDLRDNKRWICLLNAKPRRIVAELLFRLRRSPDQVRLEQLDASSIIIRASSPTPATAPRLAYIWDMPAAEVIQAHAELGRGVAP